MNQEDTIPWSAGLAELVGTAALLVVGLSAVTLDFSSLSPVSGWLGQPVLRRLVTGIFFAGTGTLVVYSRLGQRSGGHLNPAVTLGFLYLGKLRWRAALLYVVCQIVGALLGAAIVLGMWRAWTHSVHLGATQPGNWGTGIAFAAEVVATFALVTVIFQFVNRPKLMRLTPLVAGVLVATLVVLEAPISGTSLNPARSLGPALIGTTFTALWIYLIAPPLGALLAAVVFSKSRQEIACGKLVHTNRYQCHFRNCAYQSRSKPLECSASTQPKRLRPSGGE